MGRNFKRNLLILLGIILLLGAATIIMNNQDPAATPLEQQEQAGKADWQDEGPMAPDAPLLLLDGSRSSLRAYAGKPILLHFWAIWCPPCVTELPEMMKLAAKRPDVVVLAVSVDEETDALPDFIRMAHQHAQLATLPSNFIIVTDTERSLSMDTFQTLQLPETIFINTHNRMVDKVVGPKKDWLSDKTLQMLDSLSPKSDAQQ